MANYQHFFHWLDLLLLGSVDLSRLNFQQSVWYLGKAEPMWCGCSPQIGDNAASMPNRRCPSGSA
ncbi:hypothetical protein CWB81_15300 [Pseudoalteromonas sp. S1688]|nr:hypothetical protein CWB81_15300 [Pseudoalteromonas sp. S1688]